VKRKREEKDDESSPWWHPTPANGASGSNGAVPEMSEMTLATTPSARGSSAAPSTPEHPEVGESAWAVIKDALLTHEHLCPGLKEKVDAIIQDMMANSVGLEVFYPPMLFGPCGVPIPSRYALSLEMALCEECRSETGELEYCRKHAFARLVNGMPAKFNV
jgi:hypothetical protein